MLLLFSPGASCPVTHVELHVFSHVEQMSSWLQPLLPALQ